MKILANLIINGPKTIKELALDLNTSSAVISRKVKGLLEKNLVRKERKGKKVFVEVTESPLVRSFSKLVVRLGNYPPYLTGDLLKPKSKQELILALDNPKSIKELQKELGYSRKLIYDNLAPFLKLKLIKKLKKKYILDKEHSLTNPLLEIIAFHQKKYPLKEIINKLISDHRAIVIILHGSQAHNLADKLSDLDLIAITKSPQEREAVKKEYQHKKLQLDVFSQKGLVHLIRREPWFIQTILWGKILKGKVFVKDLDKIPAKGQIKPILTEIKQNLGAINKMDDIEIAKIFRHALRTIIATKLYKRKELTKENFYKEIKKEKDYKKIRLVCYSQERFKSSEIKKMKNNLLKRIKGEITCLKRGRKRKQVN